MDNRYECKNVSVGENDDQRQFGWLLYNTQCFSNRKPSVSQWMGERLN